MTVDKTEESKTKAKPVNEAKTAPKQSGLIDYQETTIAKKKSAAKSRRKKKAPVQQYKHSQIRMTIEDWRRFTRMAADEDGLCIQSALAFSVNLYMKMKKAAPIEDCGTAGKVL